MNKQVLEAAKWVWRCPETGNALVILQDATGSLLTTWVEVGDLDMGCSRVLMLRDLELAGKIRPSEESDYEYSWTMDADDEILDAVLNNDRDLDDDVTGTY